MSRPSYRPGKKIVIASIAGIVALVSLVAMGLPSNAGHVASHADITVTFAADDMGFNATSTKGLSNIIVAPCVGDSHKHEFSGPEIMWFNHTETFVIYAVYVKSGNNGVHGVGEQFLNAGVVCATPPPPPPTTTTPVPFFPSATALALGTVGALGGALLILRRRK